MVRTLLGLGLCLSPLASASAATPAPSPPEDCEALYYGAGKARDHVKALACFRAEPDWVMVAIMQLNGEGTPADVAGARASFKHLTTGDQSFLDADALALDALIKKREASPSKPGRHIAFCRDVASTTLSLATCQRRDEDRRTSKDDQHLAELRAQLAPRARPAFDGAVAAFRGFVKAESDRAYQEHIDGTIRNQAAMEQEALVRRDFMARVMALASRSPAPPGAGAKPLADADRALNDVYRENLRSYTAMFEELAKGSEATTAATYRGYVSDYKTKAHGAQHEWVRYRDAMAKLATSRWPDAPDAADLTRARITEDRVRELRGPDR